ncbi:MAG TPA: peptidylprolyl isomerase [Phycisphaerales bacterium]|nr:peptidylprolyl isomerase [Phycisphaerales bacterium]
MRFKLTTSKGDITLELDEVKAPESARNFAQYVEDGHFDGTIFHRVIGNFMVQGGGFLPDMKQKPTREGIPNEWKNGLKNKRGAIAMARVGGRPDSGTAQFFINVVDNDFLDRAQPDGAAYAVFGRVVEGMDVVDEIRKVKTGSKAGHQDVPLEPVVIEKAERLDA